VVRGVNLAWASAPECTLNSPPARDQPSLLSALLHAGATV